MTTVSIQISVGEFLDKFSILEIKKDLIRDDPYGERIKNVLLEYNEYEPTAQSLMSKNRRIGYYYRCLININRDLWNIVDAVKGLDGKTYTKEQLLELYSDCFIKTTYRFMIKSKINNLSQSRLKEQKDCAVKDTLFLYVTLARELLEYNSKINYWICFFNRTVIVMNKKFHRFGKKLFSDVDFMDSSEIVEDINNGDVTDETLKKHLYPYDDFEPVPRFLNEYDHSDTEGVVLDYLVGGRLGDMIHCLYVIYSNYLQYKIKGNIIITNNPHHLGDKFLKTPSEVIEPIREILLSQKYISSIRFDDSDEIEYDINLNLFRHSKVLYTHNWLEIMSDTFGVGFHTKSYLKFIHNPLRYDIVRPDISDYVLIHRKTTEGRICEEFTPFLKEIVSKNKCIYIYFGKDDNPDFPEIEHHQMKDLYELLYLLRNARFCVSNQTGVLAFCFAMGIPVLCEHNVERAYIGHEKYNPDFFWMSKDEKSTNFDRLKEFLNV